MIQIEQMIMRVPGMSEEEARLLGQEAAQQISAHLPEQAGYRYIPNLNVQLSLPANASRSELVSLLAENLLAQLKTA